MSTYEKSKKADEPFLITRYVSRGLTYPLAVFFCRLGVSANAVTILGGLSWVLSVVTIVFGGLGFRDDNPTAGWWWLGLSAGLWLWGYILDIVDGSIARMTNTTGAAGFFLDYLFHLIFQPMYLCSIGVFLFLVTDHVSFLVVGLLSTFCNWGVHFSAREHVLCEQVAKDRCLPACLTPEDRYEIFIDSARTREEAASKRDSLRGLRYLAEELICFPGQYALLAATIACDGILSHLLPWRFPALASVFMAICLLNLVRVPFRIRREFLTMTRLDALNREE